MKLIKLSDMNMSDAYVNPERIMYIHDLTTFGCIKSAVVFDTHEIVYVPYRASKVREIILEETDENYISYERMAELLAYEKQCKNYCAKHRRTDD